MSYMQITKCFMSCNFPSCCLPSYWGQVTPPATANECKDLGAGSLQPSPPPEFASASPSPCAPYTEVFRTAPSPLCHEPPRPPTLFGAAGILHPARRPQPSASFPSSPPLQSGSWASVHRHLSSLCNLEFLFQRLQGQPELCAVPVEGKITETSGQPLPSPETATDPPLPMEMGTS